MKRRDPVGSWLQTKRTPDVPYRKGRPLGALSRLSAAHGRMVYFKLCDVMEESHRSRQTGLCRALGRDDFTSQLCVDAPSRIGFPCRVMSYGAPRRSSVLSGFRWGVTIPGPQADAAGRHPGRRTSRRRECPDSKPVEPGGFRTAPEPFRGGGSGSDACPILPRQPGHTHVTSPKRQEHDTETELEKISSCRRKRSRPQQSCQRSYYTSSISCRQGRFFI